MRHFMTSFGSVGLLAWLGMACGSPPPPAVPPAAAPPLVDQPLVDQPLVAQPSAAASPESDRQLILKQELGEVPTPKGPCPERTEPSVLENPRAYVQRTALGLAYCILQEGPTGKVPGANDTVKVHYTGWTVDGKMFDSSVERGEPLDLPLNGVIRGWTEGLRLMTPGDKARLWIPGNLGYGRREPGTDAGTPPKGTLIFDIELIGVVAAPAETTPEQQSQPDEDDGKPRLAPRDVPPTPKAPGAG